MIFFLVFISCTILIAAQQSTIYSFETKGEKLIALTFDDGPHGTLTPRLLDALKSRDVKVTFFVMGVKAVMHPDILERAYNEGHEIANHAWNHPVLSKISRQEVSDQLTRTGDAIQSAIEKRPKVMRPPYGNTNRGLNEHIFRQDGLTVIIWSLDTLDWQRPKPVDIVQKTMERIKPGAIILCHDIHPGTIEAIPTLVDNLLAEGYQFRTVSQMIELQSRGKRRRLRGTASTLN